MKTIRHFLMLAAMALAFALQGCAVPIMLAGALPFGAAGSAVLGAHGLKSLAKAGTSTGATDKRAAYGYGTTIGGDINMAHNVTKKALKKLGAEGKIEKGGIIRATLKGQEIFIEIKPGPSSSEVLVFSNAKELALEVAEAIEKMAEAT